MEMQASERSVGKKDGKKCGSESKESTFNAGHLSLIPGLGRFPKERNGKPLQYSCLENSMDTETGGATVHGVAESDMTE